MNPLGLLRQISDHELEIMLEWRNAPTVRANMYTQHEIGLDEHLKWWEKTKNRTDQKYFMYEVEDTPCGIAALTGIDIESRNSAWAFYASPLAPRGTGSKMEFLMLEHVFNVLQLQKLYCEVLSFNTPVIKLHQKFGFNIEGVFKQQQKIDGKFVDIYRLGIFSADWQVHRQAIYEKLIKQTRA